MATVHLGRNAAVGIGFETTEGTAFTMTAPGGGLPARTLPVFAEVTENEPLESVGDVSPKYSHAITVALLLSGDQSFISMTPDRAAWSHVARRHVSSV